MAEATSGLADIFQSLPAALQVVVTFGVGIGGSIILWQRFARSFRGETPDSREMFIGGPTTFADLQPIRDLTKSVDALIQQEMKTEGAILTTAGALTAIAAQQAEFLKLLIEDREKRERADEIQESLQRMRIKELEEEALKRRRRRVSSARTRAAKTTT